MRLRGGVVQAERQLMPGVADVTFVIGFARQLAVCLVNCIIDGRRGGLSFGRGALAEEAAVSGIEPVARLLGVASGVEEVRVYVQRDRRCGVPELAGDEDWVVALGDEDAREGVTQDVDTAFAGDRLVDVPLTVRHPASRLPAGYGAAVLIAVLLFSETTVAKLAGHAITPEEVRQVADGDRIVIANPRPRVAGSVLMIGPTHGGRIVTVALGPSEAVALR